MKYVINHRCEDRRAQREWIVLNMLTRAIVMHTASIERARQLAAELNEGG